MKQTSSIPCTEMVGRENSIRTDLGQKKRKKMNREKKAIKFLSEKKVGVKIKGKVGSGLDTSLKTVVGFMRGRVSHKQPSFQTKNLGKKHWKRLLVGGVSLMHRSKKNKWKKGSAPRLLANGL